MNELLTADEPLDGQLRRVSRRCRVCHAEYRRLVAEQAAVRRVGTLVARGVEPSEVGGAVAEEMRRCVGAITAGLWRFETSGEITLVAAAAHPAALAKWPVGTRTPIDGNTLATVVQRTGLPARIDSYENIAGSVAARVRAVGVRAAVGVPIIVDGSVWGLAAVGSAEPGPMPADTETRISRFAELIATALVAGYRDEQKRQLLGEASQRPFLIDSLLEGRALRSMEPVGSRQLSAAADQWSVCRHRRGGSRRRERGVARDRIEAAQPGHVFGVAAAT